MNHKRTAALERWVVYTVLGWWIRYKLTITQGSLGMCHNDQMDRVKRIWYLSPMRAAKVQASLHIRAVSPEPSLLAHTSIESRGTFRQKARSLAPLNGWACAVKICHDGMPEDTNSLDAAQMYMSLCRSDIQYLIATALNGWYSHKSYPHAIDTD